MFPEAGARLWVSLSCHGSFPLGVLDGRLRAEGPSGQRTRAASASDKFTCRRAARAKWRSMKDRSAEVLPPPLLEAIAKGATVRPFPKNAIIVNEGDETDSLYLMVSGRARGYASHAPGREGLVYVSGAGGYFRGGTPAGRARSAAGRG